jgi:hypothetical protein
LGASASGGDQVPVTEMRRQEVELPLSCVVKYSSQALDYQQGTQQTRRVWEAVDAGDPMSVELPLVLSDQQAKTLSSRLLYLSWIERNSYQFSLPPGALLYDPGDVLDIPVDSTTSARVLLTKVEIGAEGVVSCEAMGTDAQAYLPPAELPVVPIIPAQTIRPLQDTNLSYLDAPLLSDGDDSFGFYFAGDGSTAEWPGAEVYVGRTTADYEYAATLYAAAYTGVSGTTLPAHTSALVDRTNTLRVTFAYAVTLESVTELEMLGGANRAMLGSELLSFATATQVSANVWDLSILLRGQQGTEWASSHAPGARFVLLDNVQSVEAPASGLGQTWYAKAVTVGQFLDDVTAESMAVGGIRLKPLSPVHIEGVRDGSNDLAITWVRRARVDADWRDYVETPLDEPVESYSVDIMSGSTVLRTIAASTPAAAYTAAQQTTDGITPGDPVTVMIYQISTRVGRGYPGEATL